MDKTSRALIKYLKTCDNYYLQYSGTFPKELGTKTEVLAAIRYLEEQGYVAYVRTHTGLIVGVRLEHLGIHDGEFARISLLNYLRDKWIDIAALIISIIALVGAFRKELAVIIQAIT